MVKEGKAVIPLRAVMALLTENSVSILLLLKR